MATRPGQAADTRSILRKSVAQIAQLPPGELDIESFHTFRRGVVHASRGKAGTPEDLLADLKPKAPVLAFLVAVYEQKRIYRRQVAEALAGLLQVQSWLQAVDADAAIFSRLPQDVSSSLILSRCNSVEDSVDPAVEATTALPQQFFAGTPPCTSTVGSGALSCTTTACHQDLTAGSSTGALILSREAQSREADGHRASWMYADLSSPLARLNPLRWSGQFSEEQLLKDLEARSEKDAGREILVCIGGMSQKCSTPVDVRNAFANFCTIERNEIDNLGEHDADQASSGISWQLGMMSPMALGTAMPLSFAVPKGKQRD